MNDQRSPDEPLQTDVLIVGAGPVGLALAIELAGRGVRALLIEQHDRVGVQPRAKTTNVRSMSHMRRWGIATKIREASPLPQDFPRNVIFATRLAGYELALFDNAFYGARTRDERFNEPAEWIPQYVVEAVMRDHLDTLPAASLRFNTRFESATQSRDGITADVADVLTGQRRSIKAAFLIGADGAASRVREVIGARMEGKHAYARNFSLVMHAPQLTALNPQRKALMYWLVNADAPAIVAPLDRGDKWTFGLQLPPGVTRLSETEIRDKVVRAIGQEFDFTVEVTDSWAAHSLLATSYQNGRIFLAGDACHLHPPMGGYGMNMGIGDAVDLGWKIAATLQGWGGSGLLAGYEAERRPVHRFVIDEAVTNYSVLTDHFLRGNLESAGPEGDAARDAIGSEILRTKVREFKTLGVVLGCNYSGSPLTVADGTAPPAAHFGDYQPSAHPGCLAPHAWLADGSSLYDHFGQGFTLLVTDGAGEDASRIASAAEQRGLPLRVVAPDDARLANVYGARYALIRPDQHVAWRGLRAPADIDAVIDHVAGRARAKAQQIPA
jgi:2-polyprenyl-6-methoxyphenol hydroxylase-like FAD-dependent oxidoreductase